MSRYGKHLPSQQRGKPIRAADLNAVRATAEGLSRQQIGGARMQTTIAGIPLSLGGRAGGTILLGKSPSGGIAAGATATVTLYQYGTVSTLGSQSLEVVNPGPDACPANRKIWIGEVNGVPNSVMFWSCNSA